jgi:MFS family permease
VLGGILFSELGFETTLFILALLHLAVFTVVPFISKDLIAGETTPSDLASDDCESRRPGEKQLDSEVQEEVAPDRDVEGLLWSEKAVWVAALANTLAYAALSFTDIAISPQLQRTLGLGARARGFIYFVPAALYTGISPLNGELCRRWGARRVLLVGSLLWAVSLLICGPTPPLAENGGRTYEWVMVIVGLTLNGIAMAPVVQAPLPMVNEYFKLSPSTTASSSSAGNSSALHRPFFNRTEKVRAEDAISAMMSATLSLGCTLGPIVGGVCLEFLPKTRDPGCREGPSLREISGNYAADPCTSAFGSTTTMLSGFFLLLAVAVVSIPGKPS